MANRYRSCVGDVCVQDKLSITRGQERGIGANPSIRKQRSAIYKDGNWRDSRMARSLREGVQLKPWNVDYEK